MKEHLTNKLQPSQIWKLQQAFPTLPKKTEEDRKELFKYSYKQIVKNL